MSTRLDIDVNGLPAPQGSKKGFPVRRANGTIGVALTEAAGDKVKTWRQDVRAAAENAMATQQWSQPPNGTAIFLDILFLLPRPKSHYRAGRFSDTLRGTAPHYHTTKPDADKLVRAVMDALTSAGVYSDDSAVAILYAVKLYADARPPGAHIVIQALDLDTSQTRDVTW